MKYILYKIFYRPICFFFNKKHKTKIKSNLASLKAQYAKGVSVGNHAVVTKDCKIGKYSYISPYSSVENAEIGNYCSISAHVYIGPYEHNISLLSSHPCVCSGNENKTGKVIIGHDVLISLNAIILKGVKIGNGAVVGAGAVVTHDVEPYEVVGGVPAKHIKYRFDKETIKKLTDNPYYDWDIEKIRENKEYFLNK